MEHRGAGRRQARPEEVPCGLCIAVDVDGDEPDVVRVLAAEGVQADELLETRRALGGPEVDEHDATSFRRERALAVVEVGKREVGRCAPLERTGEAGRRAREERGEEREREPRSTRRAQNRHISAPRMR